MWFPIVVLAWADTADWDEGFVSPERDDAPVDAQLVVAANYPLTASVVEGPGAPFDLDTTGLTGVGSNRRRAILPPEGGSVEPPCFDIVALSAAGEEGPTESFCLDDPFVEADEAEAGEAGCEGCRAAPSLPANGWLAPLQRRR